jgi:hypothetical protein
LAITSFVVFLVCLGVLLAVAVDAMAFEGLDDRLDYLVPVLSPD